MPSVQEQMLNSPVAANGRVGDGPVGKAVDHVARAVAPAAHVAVVVALGGSSRGSGDVQAPS